MKILAIGAAGKMGKAVAAYFAHEPGMQTLGLLDAQVGTLEPLAKADKAGRIRLHQIDIQDTDELKRVMQQYDVAVVALPNRKLSYKVMEAAIEARLDLVDILEEYHRRPDVYQTEGFVLPSDCQPSTSMASNCTRRRFTMMCSSWTAWALPRA